MEEWRLEHPDDGLLTAYVGWPDELRTIDPGFVGKHAEASETADDAAGHEPSRQEGSNEAGAEERRADTRHEHATAENDAPAEGAPAEGSPADTASEVASPGSSAPEKPWKRRLRRRLNRDESWNKQSVVLLRDGVVYARVRGIRSMTVHLGRSTPDGHFTENLSASNKPVVEVLADPLGRYVTDIVVKSDDGVVAFDPPHGSPAARRMTEMDQSPWKRIAYPVMSGLGKSGWAILVLVVGPLIMRILGAFVSWILSFFPPIHWPSIPWPDIPWPDIHWPRIPWPHIPWPHIPWPHVDLPWWLTWMLAHPKVWTPVLLALFWGVAASRNAKKSKAKKAEWAKRHEYARLAGAMRELHARRSDDARQDERPYP